MCTTSLPTVRPQIACGDQVHGVGHDDRHVDAHPAPADHPVEERGRRGQHHVVDQEAREPPARTGELQPIRRDHGGGDGAGSSSVTTSSPSRLVQRVDEVGDLDLAPCGPTGRRPAATQRASPCVRTIRWRSSLLGGVHLAKVVLEPIVVVVGAGGGDATRATSNPDIASSRDPVFRSAGRAPHGEDLRSDGGQSGSIGIERPGSRPSSTARVTAAEPKRSRTSSSAASSAPSLRRSNGSASCTASSSSRLPTRDADEREALLLDHRLAPAQQRHAPRRGSSACARSPARSVCERVARVKSSKRSRSTTVRPTRSAARIRRVDAVDQRRPAIASSSSALIAARRPSARCDPIEPPAPADLHRPRVAVVRERVQVPARRAAEQRRRAPARRAPRPRRPCDARARAASPRSSAPTPHSRSTGQRVQELELAVGRHDEQPVGLGDRARDLGEELRAGDADRDRQPDPLEHLAPQPRPRSRSACPRRAAARRRRGTPRRSTAPRRAASCRRRPRTPPCSLRSTPTCAAAPRSRAGTAAAPGGRPSRCARRTPSPRSSRRARRPPPTITGLPAQPRVVALLDRRVERVEVGVQDRRGAGHEHMFAYRSDMSTGDEIDAAARSYDMIPEPSFEACGSQPYVGVRRTTTIETFPQVVDSGWPLVFGWLAGHDVAWVAPARSSDTARSTCRANSRVDLAVPVDRGCRRRRSRGPCRRAPGRPLPRAAPRRPLRRLARRQRFPTAGAGDHDVDLAMDQTDTDEDWRSRIEHYPTNPAEQPDSSKWES